MKQVNYNILKQQQNFALMASKICSLDFRDESDFVVPNMKNSQCSKANSYQRRQVFNLRYCFNIGYFIITPIRFYDLFIIYWQKPFGPFF